MVTYLYRAVWSPSYSQCLTGYDDNEEFVHTDRVWSTEKENVYTNSIGDQFHVLSWAPDGSGYHDSKGE